MNPNKFNEKNSAELEKPNISELKSFIDPENYINYFNNRMAPNPDIKYTNKDSYEEVGKLVDAFNTLNRQASSNKEVFTNLLNFSYCRAAQFKAFNHYHIPSHTGPAFKAVIDVKSKSEFVNGVIKKCMFNEVENLSVEHNGAEFGNPSDDFTNTFMTDLTDFGPDHRQLYLDVINHQDESDIENSKTLSERYIEIEVLSLFGLDISDIDEVSRKSIFDWGVNLTNTGYEILEKVAKNRTKGNRIEMANAFLATEFGDDFGGNVLDIAEYSGENESNRIFEIINEYRKTSKEFSSQFKDIDLGFSYGAEKAMNERLTDLLAIAAEVAKNGSLTVDTAPHRDNADYQHDGKFDIKIDSLSQVIDTMETFLHSQELMWAIMNSKDTYITERYKKNVDKVYSQTYSLINDKLGIAQFHVRRFGASSFDSVVEHGNYNGTEASISWSVNPNNPFSYPGLKDTDCMNVRFDREGRSIDEAPNSPDRSPIRDDGIVSLDIGSVLGEKNSTSTIIGRTIAAGNILRSENNANKSSISLNHNTNYLPQEYGDANNFAWLATMMEQKIVNKYEHINNKKIRKIAKSLVEKSVQIAI